MSDDSSIKRPAGWYEATIELDKQRAETRRQAEASMGGVDVRTMRLAITNAMRGIVRVDGKENRDGYSAATHLTRNIIIHSERMGWSGEDTMTALAYHALVALEQSQDQLMDHALRSPVPAIFIKGPNT